MSASGSIFRLSLDAFWLELFSNGLELNVVMEDEAIIETTAATSSKCSSPILKWLVSV